MFVFVLALAQSKQALINWNFSSEALRCAHTMRKRGKKFFDICHLFVDLFSLLLQVLLGVNSPLSTLSK